MVTATKQSWTIWLRKPILIRRVSGHSMEPTLRDGQLVIALRSRRYNHDEVVIARTHKHGPEVVKRLQFANGRTDLVGDNLNPHHDIANVDTAYISGRVVWPRI